ncbi:MAG: N-acetyltransferase [Gemmatimonadetes bacterium]|nr:N-acetyltransferase [Gemmatimonadota bacterium]
MTVRPVRGRRDLGRFMKLPWSIYRGDPNWVPPLLMDLRTALTPGKHPFHEHAEVEYFLAWRGGRPVGRIAATVNRQYIDFHGEKLGFFGFFESINDCGVAEALLGAAEAWLRARGMERVQGPMNFSTNEEFCSPGVLIDGFDTPPKVMMTHSPPYYAGLLEAAGYGRAKDLLAYYLDGPTPPERLVRGVERLQKSEGITIRSLDLSDFDAEVARIKEIYNSAWERNWGFVPMTDAEFDHMARALKPVVEPRLVLIAEVRGEPVGFAIGLPDFNQVLKRINGRLLPFGLIKLLWYRRKIDEARVITLGLKPGFRKMGIDAMLYLRLFQEGPKVGIPRAECSWILEDNWDMRRGLERMGARVYKTYRVYEREL